MFEWWIFARERERERKKERKRVHVLLLTENIIKAEGMTVLSEALEVNTTLTELDLSREL